MAIQDSTFLNIFTAYINIPGLDDGDTVLSALIVGVVAAVYVILNTVKNRRERAKKGYRQNSAAADYLKAVIIAALILAYCYMLSQYRGISVMLVWVVAICLIYNFITAKTAFGRYFYAVGGNERAATLSGIKTKRIKLFVYMFSALMAAICSMINTSQLRAAHPAAGESWEMNAIASVVLGGTSMSGGIGTIGGTIVGALVINVLNDGMTMMGVSSFWQQVIRGVVIVVAVVIDQLQASLQKKIALQLRNQ